MKIIDQRTSKTIRSLEVGTVVNDAGLTMMVVENHGLYSLLDLQSGKTASPQYEDITSLTAMNPILQAKIVDAELVLAGEA